MIVNNDKRVADKKSTSIAINLTYYMYSNTRGWTHENAPIDMEI